MRIRIEVSAVALVAWTYAASLLLAAAPPAVSAQQCPTSAVRRIVYRQITYFAVDSSGIRPDPGLMKMSADGSRIAFVANQTHLWTIDTANGAMRQVVDVVNNNPSRDRINVIDISAN